MSNDHQWIATRVAEARKHHPLVTDDVCDRIQEWLNGRLSERQLPPAELKSVTAALIADMAPAPPKVEATK